MIDKGQHAVDFINRLTHTKGKFAGKRFNLRPWQEDIIRRIFGTLKPDGTRQYREVYVEIPRKNGKSELAAAIALYLLLGDGEVGAEVYSAASDKDQASLVFDVAAQMCRNDGKLQSVINIVDSKKRITYPRRGSFYRAISAEANTKHGFNASGVVYDELHTAPNRDLYDVLTTSMGAREQPLTFMITTAGHDVNSICYEMHDYALKVRDGLIDDPTFLPIIFAAEPPEDESQDPDWWLDEEQWFKANPALGDFRNIEEMRKEARKAKEIIAYQNTFKRLYLNVWTEQETRWLDMDKWKKAGSKYGIDDLRGLSCYLGMDLSTKLDLTAVGALFPPTSDFDRYRAFLRFYMPEERIKLKEKKDKVPYRKWRDQGFITTTPGDIIDYTFIRHDINNLFADAFRVMEIGYDPWNATQLATQLSEEDGFELVEVRQGIASMGESTKEFEALIASRQFDHGNNPVLNWMASNVSVRCDANNNYMPVKPDDKKPFRIDGIVALIIALARAIVNNDDGTQPYERGLIVL
ncbi:MAG: terminase large subunit [Pseudomonadales bacterium]|nr:terminase large subunit [Pseudomonadales bacterium]